MTAKLLAGGVAALTIIGAAAAGIAPAARASTDQSGIWVQRVTRGPYAQDATAIPLGGCFSAIVSLFCEAPPPDYAEQPSRPPSYRDQETSGEQAETTGEEQRETSGEQEETPGDEQEESLPPYEGPPPDPGLPQPPINIFAFF